MCSIMMIVIRAIGNCETRSASSQSRIKQGRNPAMPDFHDVKLVDISILLWITTLNLEN